MREREEVISRFYITQGKERERERGEIGKERVGKRERERESHRIEREGGKGEKENLIESKREREKRERKREEEESGVGYREKEGINDQREVGE
eukprot:1343496-Amorphochlora_amoeboformis.AAC.1